MTLSSVAGIGRAIGGAIADPRVQTLGAFADDDEVDVGRSDSRQRARHAGEQFHRTQIDEMVEFESQPQQESALEDAARHTGIADRS